MSTVKKIDQAYPLHSKKVTKQMSRHKRYIDLCVEQALKGSMQSLHGAVLKTRRKGQPSKGKGIQQAVTDISETLPE